MKRRFLAVLGVIILIGLSGCATVSISAEVNDVNTIDEYEINISTSTTAYAYLESVAEEDGYENVEELLTEDLYGSNISESIDYTEEIDGNEVTISVMYSELYVRETELITIEERDGELIYRDETVQDEDFDSSETQTTESFVLEYELQMPNEISESNADEVDGDTATWRRTGEDAYRGFVVEAESPEPTSSPIPGFGVLAATVALAAVALLGVYRRN